MSRMRKPTGAGLLLERAEAVEYGQRGGAGRRESLRTRVGDDYVTAAEIAVRVGCTARTAADRLRRAQAADGPVTWLSLGLTA